MKSLYIKAKNAIKYLGIVRKTRSQSTNSLDNISGFYSELCNMGIIPDYKINQVSGTIPEALFEGKKVLMFASNDYLGLSMRPEVIEGAKRQVERHGLGPGGSRFLCGNVDILETLDKKTAELVGTEDAMTFPTGYMANNGAFQGIMDPLLGSLPFSKGTGVIFSDEFNHGSIVEGCRLSHAKKVIFRHNDLEDLKRKMTEYQSRSPKMIITEGVFTPHGDISPLHGLKKIAKEFGAILMIDDAHGIGVLGKKGGGTTQHFGLDGDVDLVMGSFDKAMGGMGGFLAGKKKLIEYLRVSAKPYMLSSAVPAVMAGGLVSSIDICMNENSLREKLFSNANYIRHGLENSGFKILGDSMVPVVLVYIGDEIKSIKFANKLFENGIYCPSFRWPVVPQGESRMRVTPMATHTKDQLDKLISVFDSVGREMNII